MSKWAKSVLCDLDGTPVTVSGGVLSVTTAGSTAYTSRYDEGSTYTYIGTATPGTATSSPLWLIKRMTNADLTILFANGSANFNVSWDSRASLTYI